MFNSIKYIISTSIFFFYFTLQAQYHDSTFMISFEPGTTQAEIDLAMVELNSDEIDITPISNTRLWKVRSFPFQYPPTGEMIADINETDKEASQRAKTNGGGLNYVPIGITGTSIPIPNIPNDDQLDCQGQLNTYISNGNNEVRVGIFDTGLTYFSNPSIPGYFFDLEGFDQWDHLDNDAVAQDDHGHGSHMASVVSHTVNKAYGLGHTFTEPQETYDVRRSFDGNGNGYLFEIIDAMEEAALNGMNVASCSWSFKSEESDAYRSCLYLSLSLLADQYGVLLVAAAGNDGENIDDGRMLKNYPASYDLDNIITAASYNCADDVTAFSNWGEISIDIVLPGNNLAGLENDNIVFRSGTSQSTALLAGIAASLGTHQAQFDYGEIICAIMTSAENHPSVGNKVKSGGIVDAEAALSLLGDCHSYPGGHSRERSTTMSTRLFPNPSTGQYTLVYNSSKEEARLRIDLYDLQGKLLRSDEIMTKASNTTIEFDDSLLRAGTYNLVLKSDGYLETHKLVIR